MIDLTTTQFTDLRADGKDIICAQICLQDAFVIDPDAARAAGASLPDLHKEVRARLMALLWRQAYGEVMPTLRALIDHAHASRDPVLINLTNQLVALLRPQMPDVIL